MSNGKESSGRKTVQPTPDQLLQTLRAFVEAQTWPESKQILLQHPELLSEEAEHLLASLMASQSSLQGMQLLLEYSDLLERCRREGIDAAFAPLISSPATPEYPPEFAPDIRRLVELEEEAQRDPGAYRELVALIRGILRRLQRDSWPLFRAALLAQLGTVYKESPTGDRETNLEMAVAAYRGALAIYTPETAPRQYAATQIDLGNAYRSLPDDHLPENLEPALGRRQSNLEQAIACYKEALRGFTPERAPNEYALTQVNLGDAYLSLSTDAAIIKAAIASYEEALRFLDPEVDPVRYSLAQSNLRAARTRVRDSS